MIMDRNSGIQNLDNHYVRGLQTDFFKRKLLLNMFGVYDKFGVLLLKPVMKDEFDVNYEESIEYYNELSETILFTDFYIDEEIGELTLLRNDVLGITIAIIHRDNESKLEFIGEKTIGDLVEKYPSLLY
jgi:hypothetical protein